MTPLMVGQLIFIVASLFYIIRTARKMPKFINYTILGTLAASIIATLLIAMYRPEWLEPMVEYMNQLNDTLNI